MTDRKPALKRYTTSSGEQIIIASDLPPAILNATKEELAALAVFAEAMPELMGLQKDLIECPNKWDRGDLYALLGRSSVAALAAAEETTHD